MIYDCVIIGSGPAGLSAALNLKIHNKKFVWLGSNSLSDKVNKAEQISNYPGFIDISGTELNEAFKKQVDAMGIEIVEGVVNSIIPMGKTYALMVGSEFYEAYTIILATGVVMQTTLPNEANLVGKGVSYCATCDGRLYKDKTIAVICNSSRFEHEVKYLSEIVAKLYYFPLYKDVMVKEDNIEVMKEKVIGMIGEKHIEKVKLTNQSELAVDGVFCLRDSMSLQFLLPKIKVEKGHVEVNRKMETNLDGIYAAGDCTGRPYQYSKAIGEGNVAAHSVIEFLAERSKNNAN